MTSNLQPFPVETAFSFDCQGANLIGVIHHAPGNCEPKVGVITIVAGGPQYRGGCGRQLVELGRRLAAEGTPVLRFDHRGIGDSNGPFLGFQHIKQDLTAAIREFRQRVPSLQKIVLWGGCDAASAALINAHRHPEVVSIVAANPFVSTEYTAARVRKKHYISRLRQGSFWRKLVTFQYNPMDYLLTKAAGKKESPAASGPAANSEQHYLDAMREGLERFQGEVLFLMSGRSLISKEFDALLDADPRWRRAYEGARHKRIEVENADQTFSSRSARVAMLDAASDWASRFRSK